MSSVTRSKITSQKVASAYDEVILRNYGNPPFALVKGEGSYVWDAEKRRYLDFSSGIAVNTLGHCHPHWVEQVQRQAATLAHVSNLYYVPEQARLAQRLVERIAPGRVFFCNSGAEANEFLIKLARLHGKSKADGEEGRIYKVITAENGFHGRTFGGMSATAQKKIQDGFGPMLDGFKTAEFNNLESFREAVDEETAAILVETIQGEGGIIPATPEFLQGLRGLCDEKGILLMIDEVQCGIGRTGHFLAYEPSGIIPDAVGMAKGLGGGFPIGAGWVKQGYDELFLAGSHGTTFGGSPLACAAANAVLDVIEEENLLDRVTVQSAPWHDALRNLVEKHPDRISGFRGVGYHAALVLKEDPAEWMAKLREQGLLTVRGGHQALRLMPPLNVSATDLDTAVEILDFAFGTSD